MVMTIDKSEASMKIDVFIWWKETNARHLSMQHAEGTGTLHSANEIHDSGEIFEWKGVSFLFDIRSLNL